MSSNFTNLDWFVLLGYLLATVSVGFYFHRSGSIEGFTAGNRSLPGWAIGLSMFGSYISSISFLANPGTAYASNWNAFVFSLATPIAAAIAVRWFVPFYRRIGAISAYEHLEQRFGAWARTYAVVCFLLVQMARMGTVVYLLALAMAPITGWKVQTTILLTGAVMTLYTVLGGIKAVVWTGVLQSAVLVAGTLICLVAIVQNTTGGLSEIIGAGIAEHKFSPGSFSLSLAEPTFWVVFVYGLTINLSNFAVDQSYVQRYITARSDTDAKKSVWLTAVLYVPVAAIFFFIGTGLYVFYGQRPDLLGSITKADEVFPSFISTQLSTGMAGVVVAAIFAASMDSNLNSMATLTYWDLYKRYIRPNASEYESLVVLRIATLAWGAICTGVGLAMIQAESALDAWWQLAGIFSGGVLGLFLLGNLCRSATSAAGLAGVVTGVLVIAWMVFSPYWGRIDADAHVSDTSRRTIVVDPIAGRHLNLGELVHLRYSWLDEKQSFRTADESRTITAISDSWGEIELDEPLKAKPTGSVAIFDDGVWYRWRSPFHNYLTVVVGTCVVLGTGFLIGGASQLITGGGPNARI
ncbi:MAG: sodium:solute symporter [Pirellulales bacterium]